jgi:hypothetical protein
MFLARLGCITFRLNRSKASITLMLVSWRQALDAQSHDVPESFLYGSELDRPQGSGEIGGVPTRFE